MCGTKCPDRDVYRRKRLESDGNGLLTQMLNSGSKGGEVWEVVQVFHDPGRLVMEGEVARGALVRVAQADMHREARRMYNWADMTALGVYSVQVGVLL